MGLWLLQLLGGRLPALLKLLHRDIKPATIFLHRGDLKLGDLGLSKHVIDTMSGAQKHAVRQPFLAPEVHMGQYYDKAVDIWGLGWVVHEMITPRPRLPRARQRDHPAQDCLGAVRAHHGDWSEEITGMVKAMLKRRPTTGRPRCSC